MFSLDLRRRDKVLSFDWRSGMYMREGKNFWGGGSIFGFKVYGVYCVI